MICEMCGRNTETVRAVIEDIELTVCESCANYGQRLGKPPAPRQKPTIRAVPRRKELLQAIVPDFSQQIRKAREKLGKTQKEFAQMIAEKESVIHHLETGSQQPSIHLARKLEKKLHIRLVESVEEDAAVETQSSSEEATLGDFIKIKK